MLKVSGESVNSFAKFWPIFFASIIFAGIKFLLDYFAVNFYIEALVLVLYYITASLIINKIRHISKLIINFCVFCVYYACIVGSTAYISAKIGKTDALFIGNYFHSMVIGFTLIFYSLFSLVTAYFKSKKLVLTKQCELVIGGKKIKFNGFLDTGNSLIDPLTKKSVVILNISVIKKVLSDQMYADILFSTNSSGKFKQIHKIKYSTLSSANFITVFVPESFKVSGNKIDCAVAINLKNNISVGALLGRVCM